VSHSCPTLMDENGSDTNGYQWYYICFYIVVRIRIRIRIVSTMPDRIQLDIDIINIQFQYSDTVSDIEYIWTQIWTDLNPSERIRFQIRSENIRTGFIPAYTSLLIFSYIYEVQVTMSAHAPLFSCKITSNFHPGVALTLLFGESMDSVDVELTRTRNLSSRTQRYTHAAG
jgi:hypothetical protein